MANNGVKLEKKTLVFSQDGDTCQDEPDNSQEIKIETERKKMGCAFHKNGEAMRVFIAHRKGIYLS